MRKLVFEGTKIGAMSGFSLAFAYSVIFLIIRQFWNNFDSLVFIIAGLIFVLIFASLIGAITGTVFGIVLAKVHPVHKTYVIVCLLFCLVMVLPVYTYILKSFTHIGYWDPHVTNSVKLTLEFIVLPSIIYISAGAFISHYLYLKSISLFNVTPPTS